MIFVNTGKCGPLYFLRFICVIYFFICSAVVTGASEGIGKGYALEVNHNGLIVYMTLSYQGLELNHIMN